MKHTSMSFAALLAFLQWSAPLYADTVGKVVLAAGAATALRAGAIVPLARGSAIEDKDVLQTGPNTILQVRFADESIVALREQSRLAVEEFRYSGKADGQESAVFRLVKGSFRTITGLIGRVDHRRYSVGTAVATIGIRGTMYSLAICNADCTNDDGTRAPDGLYGAVTGPSMGSNKISVQNQAGESILNQGQFFRVATIDSPPVFLLQPPSFLSNRLPGKPTAMAAGGGQTGTSGIGADSRANLLPPALDQIAATTSDMRTIAQSQNIGANGLPVGVMTQGVTFDPIGGAGVVRGQLIWTSPGDMDLHLLTPGGGHAFYANRTVNFAGATAQLDADNTSGGTPASPAVENIAVTGPA
ncbi:MAG: FecR domain-containing protein, partial [Burkholderiales bacterium]